MTDNKEPLMSKETLRELFIKYLTVDSETKDARRKEFNQAIFDAKEGWAVWTETDLDMVMEKFDKAAKEWLSDPRVCIMTRHCQIMKCGIKTKESLRLFVLVVILCFRPIQKVVDG